MHPWHMVLWLMWYHLILPLCKELHWTGNGKQIIVSIATRTQKEVIRLTSNRSSVQQLPALVSSNSLYKPDGLTS